MPRPHRLADKSTPLSSVALSESHSAPLPPDIAYPAPKQVPPPQSTPPPPSRRPLRRLFFLATLSLSSLTLGLYLSTHPRTSTLLSLLPPSVSLQPPFSTLPPSALETYILNHPLAARLRADPRWTESRPHLLMPPLMRAHSMTAHSLLGPDRIPTAPLVFTREQEGKKDMELVSLVYLGADLSGHVGIVHGGMVATLMDEGLARCCFAALPNGVGVTARLEVDFKRPARSDGWVVLKARVEEVEGRKAWVRGRLEVLGEGEGGKGEPWEEKGEVLAEGRGLFVEPRWAKRKEKGEADEGRRIYRSCSNRCEE
ncbi:MAG: hypothetical protein LQ351_006663 [Letrouitia transgressa]|nr:MAG: hypothetical protein LQ351_006663 [Letrouitia transgressa]